MEADERLKRSAWSKRREAPSTDLGNAYVSVFGDYAYAWATDKVTLVDLRSGNVVATLPKPPLYLVAADSYSPLFPGKNGGPAGVRQRQRAVL